METAFPTIAVFLFMAVIALAYLDKVKAIFAGHPVSPDRELDDQQKKRFQHYMHAKSLQLATNRWHNLAIKAKSRYEIVGVIACCVAPSLIILAAAVPELEKFGMASDRGVTIAQGVACALVLWIIVAFRIPTKPRVEERMRAEFLRCHLHCLLARVGPYAVDESAAEQVEKDATSFDAEMIAVKLRELEQQCIRQAEGTESLPSVPIFTLECADAYMIERVGEQSGDIAQKGFFRVAAERMHRSYTYSAKAVVALVALATVIGVIRIVVPGILDPFVAEFLFASCGALAVLAVGLRAVFGWDSKASLYVRQIRELEGLAKSLQAARDKVAHSVEDGALAFQRRAAAFEALMAREACDWKLITDREYYDVTF